MLINWRPTKVTIDPKKINFERACYCNTSLTNISAWENYIEDSLAQIYQMFRYLNSKLYMSEPAGNVPSPQFTILHLIASKHFKDPRAMVLIYVPFRREKQWEVLVLKWCFWWRLEVFTNRAFPLIFFWHLACVRLSGGLFWRPGNLQTRPARAFFCSRSGRGTFQPVTDNDAKVWQLHI